jgi:hypothetical protein
MKEGDRLGSSRLELNVSISKYLKQTGNDSVLYSGWLFKTQ